MLDTGIKPKLTHEPRCPTCGHPVLEHALENLSPREETLVKALDRAGARGLTMEQIIEIRYPPPQDIPLTVKFCIYSFRAGINRKLKNAGLRISGCRNGRYFLELSQ